MEEREQKNVEKQTNLLLCGIEINLARKSLKLAEFTSVFCKAPILYTSHVMLGIHFEDGGGLKKISIKGRVMLKVNTLN